MCFTCKVCNRLMDYTNYVDYKVIWFLGNILDYGLTNCSKNRMKYFVNHVMSTILKPELTLHLCKLQQSRVQKKVLKLVQNVMEWFLRLKKLWLNPICITNLACHVLIAAKNWIPPTFMMQEMDIFTVANAILQSKLLFILVYSIM